MAQRGRPGLSPEKKMKYGFDGAEVNLSVKLEELLTKHRTTFPICFMWRVLEVSCSGYYAWLKAPVSA